MMAWMTGIGLLGWVLLIALLVTIIVVVVRLLTSAEEKDPSRDTRQAEDPQRKSGTGAH